MRSILLACAIAFAVSHAVAGKAPKPEIEKFTLRESVLDISNTSYPWMSDGEYKTALKLAHERANRKIASTGVDYESAMSEGANGLKALRERILNIKSASEIDPLLSHLEKNYDSLTDDAKLVAAEVLTLKPFKGIVYRMVPLAAKTNITHSVLLSFVMRQAAQMRVYFPTTQAEALFAYLTQPYDGVVQFKEGEDFQAFLGDIVYPVALKSSERIKAIPVSTPLVWDNKILYSGIIDKDIDTQDRYTLIGPAEKWAILAAKQMGMHYLTGFRAYTVKNLMAMCKDMGSLYGVDGFTTAILPNGAVDGVSAKERIEVFSRAKFKNTFVIYTDGSKWMERSFNHLSEAVKYLRIAWDEVKDKPAAENFLLNPAFFSGFDRQINNHLAVLEQMVQGPTKIRSRLTGETIVVDLKSFYLHPPVDVKSLIPTMTEKSQKFNSIKVKIANKAEPEAVNYYNYFNGRPTNWNLSAYKTLFPELKSGADVGGAARILAQSWGGAVLAGPLRAVVR